MKYRIEYSPETLEHLRALSARQQATVLDTVEKQLSFQPTMETRNRKPMRPNPVAPWELRIGNLRVYYHIDGIERIVRVLAVGIKQRDQVRIGKKVIKL
ncbi:MAG TPA: type II toxin-antitoxin system RelE/ParE family toxin [bacterium]|nr:type II toxin-antitoxin system RelE/ParE family toxin [bacterium]